MKRTWPLAGSNVVRGARLGVQHPHDEVTLRPRAVDEAGDVSRDAGVGDGRPQRRLTERFLNIDDEKGTGHDAKHPARTASRVRPDQVPNRTDPVRRRVPEPDRMRGVSSSMTTSQRLNGTLRGVTALANGTSPNDVADQSSDNPGRDVQKVGTAELLGEDVRKIHDPVWAVLGNLGDSQCYLGVQAKVAAVQAALSHRVASEDLPVRLIPPGFTLGVSDGQLNGTAEMRFSLIGRELVNDATSMHLAADRVTGLIAVVACDKPPVGTVAALLEHNAPSVVMSDGSIRPGIDPATGAPIDIITAFQAASDPDEEVRARLTLNACPGQGSCGGMFTYNTMQTFIAVLGLEPLHMVSPASEDPRRTAEFPGQLVDCLVTMAARGIRPRDIVTPASLRNALTVTMAMGGSTNVMLHSVEIARAAGIDLWDEVMTQAEFNALSRRLPVLVNMRPFGSYSMVDVEASGGVPAVVRELLADGYLDANALTCTGETLGEQIGRLDPPLPDHRVIYSVARPFKDTGGLRLLQGNLAPGGGAILKLAGVEGGMSGGVFTGNARVFNGEQALIRALDERPGDFRDNDMVVIRYEGPGVPRECPKCWTRRRRSRPCAASRTSRSP